MSDNLPNVTVLIPTRPDLPKIIALIGARALDYPADKLEIIVARGKQPSVQRNAGLKAARGEIIYFLDDDSLVLPGNLRRAVEHFRDPLVKIVGGPSLCPPDAPELEQVFALVLSSWAFASSRARYASVGAVREASEKELILCNMAARRAALVELSGFNEALYPNEENALMDELQKRGDKLIYDPELIVYRRPRPTLTAFCRMLMTYGRGRAEQFRETPTFGSALNFVPPAFLVYLVALPVLAWRAGAIVFAPLGLYIVVGLVQVLLFVSRGRCVRSLRAFPLILLTLVLYGFGFWRGLFTKLKPPEARADVQVKLEKM